MDGVSETASARSPRPRGTPPRTAMAIRRSPRDRRPPSRHHRSHAAWACSRDGMGWESILQVRGFETLPKDQPRPRREAHCFSTFREVDPGFGICVPAFEYQPPSLEHRKHAVPDRRVTQERLAPGTTAIARNGFPLRLCCFEFVTTGHCSPHSGGATLHRLARLRLRDAPVLPLGHPVDGDGVAGQPARYRQLPLMNLSRP